ncbi:MAG: hypothetical protein A3G18_05415 [Rhodospirillales bacterium RIFCSPLOWO2_12_FULL_58_28]|nr:MAG: hypothetical protein A3H92_05720 [Rhodospirillales bacterium RIFCSPLOWO2_02_FULL_58_16]OHC79394.1 MAG: hypothetical protein A3G18_05415 [Rhodospirillales bacterium RIFCSPLOWO2_12_FULL_58_28]
MNELVNKKTITYAEAKELARHEDHKVRLALAARKDISPEILYFMAEDASAEVRREIAANAATPRHADLLLARDEDSAVRTGLAEKIAKVAPGMSANEQSKLRQMTHEALEILTRDQAVRVRQILSETLKDVANVPPELIKRLALDAEAAVAGPVLEFSPVLTDEDLIEIIETGPAKGGLNAISRRSGVNEGVADAIVGANDISAIADLLSNDSAQIREETLDNLIDRASEIDAWHAPLVSRPKLPASAAPRMARFLADNLLGVLQQRADLDKETLEAVKAVVLHRLGEEGAAKGTDSGHPMDFSNFNSLIPMAERLHQTGKLDNKIIAKAMHASDNDFVLAALTVRSGVSPGVVQKVFSSRNAKGVTSLAWKAGLPMKLAFHLQQRIARIMPSEVITSQNENAYPLSEDEMTWQIEFFSNLPSGKKG